MRRRVLLDTGPLVAFLNRKDKHHLWANAQFGAIEPPLLSCEAVLSEACFLLRNLAGGSKAVFDLLDRGLIELPFRLAIQKAPVKNLLIRYADVPMSLADACLVRMAELHAGSTVLTIDGDFQIYRKHGRQVIPAIMPENVAVDC